MNFTTGAVEFGQPNFKFFFFCFVFFNDIFVYI